MNINDYLKQRKKRLFEKIKDNSALLLFSGLNDNQDGIKYFFVNRNFLYLSNFVQENSFILFLKTKNEYFEYAFVDQYDEKVEKWYGKKLTFKDVSQASNINIKNIFSNENLIKKIEYLLNKKKIKYLYLDLNSNDAKINEIKNKYEKKYKIINCYDIICDLRIQKDKLEINHIINAIKITFLGLKEIIKKVKNAKNEFEIYSLFNYTILNNGARTLAFDSIIASGINACYLHYPTPYSKINKNELILCDVGAEFKYYASDITRTFPINGKFSQFQKKIYNIVLECNKKIISLIKPGITLEFLQYEAKLFLTKKCLEEKIITKSKEIDSYYYHGVSHHLGLEVHDMYKKNDLKNIKLKEGMIITVEPGLYIKDKKIGIRIEDDVLITKNGHKCLSLIIPKEVKDIEKIMNQ